MEEKDDDSGNEKSGCALTALKILAFIAGILCILYLVVWRVPHNSALYQQAVQRSQSMMSASGVAREKNGWIDYEQALNDLESILPPEVPKSPSDHWLDSALDKGLDPALFTSLMKLPEHRKEAFALIDRGYGKPYFVVPFYHIPFNSGLAGARPAAFPRFLDLGKLLILLGDCQLKQGDCRGAARRYLQALCLGMGIGRCGNAGRYLSGEKIARMAANRLEVVVLRSEADEALCRQVCAEMQRLGKDTVTFSDLLSADFAMFTVTYGNIRNSAVSPGMTGSQRWTFALAMPYYEREMKIFGNYYLDAVRESSKGYREGTAFFSLRKKPLFSTILNYTTPPWKTYFPLYCGSRATYGGVTLFAALQCYKREKGGYPTDLQALVPAYLPSLPADPFAADGKFIYRLKDKVPVFYSIAFNGKDDGGAVQAHDPEGDGDIIFMDGKEH
jgi:hypothetical protein